MKTKVYLGLGGNAGDMPANLAEAAVRLEARGIRILHLSPVYRTEPVGLKNQAWFLNQALEVESDLAPAGLLRIIKRIEREMGRKPGPRNGPRPIDIDILLAGETIRRSAALEIPHPRLAERRFALVPLAAIAPGAVHPGAQRTIRSLLRRCPDHSRVIRLRRGKERPSAGRKEEMIETRCQKK